MMTVLRRWPRRVPLISLIYACLLLLSCFAPATGEDPGPSRDTRGPPCLDQDHPCSSVSDSSGLPASHQNDAEEAIQTSAPSSEQHTNPEAEVRAKFSHESKGEDQEAKEDEGAEQDHSAPEAERVLVCILSSVPLVGGKWFAKMLRSSFSDSALLEASHSFLEGGEMVSRFVDLGTTSTAAKMIGVLGRCFEEVDESHAGESASGSSEAEGQYQDDYLDSVSNLVERDFGPRKTTNVPHCSKDHKSSPSTPQHRRKRRLARSGYGGDSLLGFNLLAFLVVGSLLTYLVYLLVA